MTENKEPSIGSRPLLKVTLVWQQGKKRGIAYFSWTISICGARASAGPPLRTGTSPDRLRAEEEGCPPLGIHLTLLQEAMQDSCFYEPLRRLREQHQMKKALATPRRIRGALWNPRDISGGECAKRGPKQRYHTRQGTDKEKMSTSSDTLGPDILDINYPDTSVARFRSWSSSRENLGS